MGTRLVLTSEDTAGFERAKKRVHAGLETFMDVAAALLEIRENGWYRSVCSTFEAFCQIEFRMSRQRAYQLIAAGETVQLLSTTVDTPVPDSERVARPLTALPPAQQQEAWQEAVAESDGQPTAKKVKEVVERRTGVKVPKPKKHETPDDMAAKLVASTKVQPPSGPAPEAPQAASTDGHKNPLATSEVGEPTGASSTPGPVSEDSLSEGEAGRRLARVVDAPKPYTHRMKVFVAAAVDAASATDEEIAAIPANDVMLRSLRNAREVLDRIIAHHSKERKHG